MFGCCSVGLALWSIVCLVGFVSVCLLGFCCSFALFGGGLSMWFVCGWVSGFFFCAMADFVDWVSLVGRWVDLVRMLGVVNYWLMWRV